MIKPHAKDKSRQGKAPDGAAVPPKRHAEAEDARRRPEKEIFQGLEEAVMGDHPAEHAQLIICTKKNDSREKRKKEKPDLVTDDLAHLLKHPFEEGTVPIRLFSLASGVGETVDFSIEVHLAFFPG